ncbi:TetR/AcrR family transcriptional regulator [Desulfolutivibrio sulfoxidireducens]|uniref:TetR/AcrR family transcriptional regulator n=1 Tax=Desulfolutivibrio sulfoxidireducens TaxID=2773299 RepID=UPI00159DDF6F|nr:TetR/AcrR family transcriptional regulator [Desulfolutivibrio sulfoxidireducens]
MAVKRRILEAAAEVFAREGFAGARVEHIAKAAGVNKAGLYYHVGNKARLFEEVMVEHFAEVASRMERAVASSEDPSRRLDALVRSLAEAFEEKPARARIMLIEIARGGVIASEPVMRQVVRVFRCTDQVVRGGVRDGAFEPENPFFVHMCLIGSLVLFTLSAPQRERAAAMGLGRENGIDPMAPLADMVSFLSGMLGRGLAASGTDKKGGDGHAG